MDIAFDIETIPNSAMADRLPPVEIKAGNLKDPAKIAEKEAAARAEQVEKMALSPLYGRMCAWVAIDDGGPVYNGCIAESSDEAETVIIEKAFETLSGKRIITYNGNGFDLPFIYRRAVLLGFADGSVSELALDLGTLSGPARSLPLCELELELKAGGPHATLALLADLRTRFGLEPETRSKLARARTLE